MERYKPCPPTFLAQAIALSHDPWFLMEERWWAYDDYEFISWGPKYGEEGLFRVMSWKEFMKVDWERMQMEFELRPDPYECVRSDPIVKRALAKMQAERDERHIRRHAHECVRTLDRTAQVKSELLKAHSKMQSILRCHAIKEELYQKVYHPRRIEKLLTHGGWDALENFAGL